MSDINCNACNELKKTSPSFAQKGITSTECTSLAADTGINPNLSPKHNDSEDLHDMNDCLVGVVPNDLESYDVCDWQDFMARFIPNMHTMFKGIICALGGIWTYIHNLLSRVASLESRMTNVEGRVSALETWRNTIDAWKSGIDSWKSGIDSWKTSISTTVNNHNSAINYQASQISDINKRIDDIIAAMGGDEDEIPVMRRFRFTVPAEAFAPAWRTDDGSIYRSQTDSWVQTIPDGMGIVEWFSGGGNNEDVGEMWIKIPVSEMDSITGVWTQTYVVPSGNSFDGRGKAYMQTVNVQEWYREGNYLIINFDTYILAPQRLTAEESPTNPQNGGPYPVTVDFLVVGKKTINI